jgi:phage-related protein
MNDYAQYFTSLQSAQLANQIANIKTQEDQEQRQATAPLGELVSTEGIKEGISKTISSVKDAVLEKAKDVASQAMKKAGVDDDTIKSILEGNVKEAIQGKVEQAIAKAKTVAQSAVDDAKQTATDAISTTRDAVNSATEAIPTQEEALSSLSRLARPQATNDLLPEGAGDIIEEGNSQVANAISDGIDNARAVAGDAVDTARNAFSSLFGSLKSSVSDASSVARGLVSSASSTVQEALPNFSTASITTENLASKLSSQNPSSFFRTDAGYQQYLNEFGKSAGLPDDTIAPSTSASTAVDVSSVIGPAGPTQEALQGVGQTLQDTLTGTIADATNAVTGADITSGIAGVASTVASVGEDVASTALSSLADVALGPLGILAGLGTGIASLVEAFKKPHQITPVNASAQFL